MENLELLLQAISTVGFPIGMATYTIVKMDRSINAMNDTLIKLSELIKHTHEKE